MSITVQQSILNQILQKLDTLQEEKFNIVEEKFNGMDERFKGIDNRLDDLNKYVNITTVEFLSIVGILVTGILEAV